MKKRNIEDTNLFDNKTGEEKSPVKLSNFFMIIGAVLLFASIFYYINATQRIDSRKSEILEQKELFLQEQSEIDTLTKAKKEEAVDLISVVEEKKQRQADEKSDAKKLRAEEKAKKIAEEKRRQEEKARVYQEAISYIEIQKIGVILPVFMDTSFTHLMYGVGVVEGTDAPNPAPNVTSVLAGHRGGYYGEQTFLRINELTDGDTLVITTQNEDLVYEYSSQEVISSTDWSHFYREQDKSKLVLLTCHPYPQNTERLIVNFYLKEIIPH